jgi:hypothetical protein
MDVGFLAIGPNGHQDTEVYVGVVVAHLPFQIL